MDQRFLTFDLQSPISGNARIASNSARKFPVAGSRYPLHINVMGVGDVNDCLLINRTNWPIVVHVGKIQEKDCDESRLDAPIPNGSGGAEH